MWLTQYFSVYMIKRKFTEREGDIGKLADVKDWDGPVTRYLRWGHSAHVKYKVKDAQL